MSDPDWPPTRRGLIAGFALATLGGAAMADETPYSERFVTFDPPVPLRPTMLQDRDGRPRLLAPRPGRLGLVALWATWCPACRHDLPGMAAAQQDLARAGLDVAAVNVEATPRDTVLRRAADIATGTVPMFFDPDGIALAAPYPDGHRSPLQVFGMPILFLVDRTGRVRGYLKGAVDWSDPTVAATFLALAEGTGSGQ